MSTQPTPDIDSLWARYKASGDRGVRDELIVHYAPLVRFAANRVGAGLPQNVDVSDLVSYGTLGLIDAIEKFDTSRGYKFETYAMSRIKGHILDELRSMDWVPRSVRSKARTLERAFSGLEAKLHRAPTEEELADELDLSVPQLQTMLGQVSFTNLVALDEMSHGERGNGGTLADALADSGPGPAATYEVEEMRQTLVDAIGQLSERERTVVTLYYFEGLTLAEIGRVLNVTESRVCQIHTKSVLHLRHRVEAAEREPA